MPLFRTLSASATLVGLVAALWVTPTPADPLAAPAHLPVDTANLEQWRADQEALLRSVSLDALEQSHRRSPGLLVPFLAEDDARLDNEDCDECPAGARAYQVGVNKGLGMPVDFGGLDAGTLADEETPWLEGTVRRQGAQVSWTLPIEAPGASAFRLHLTDLDLPEGVELLLVSPATNEVYGPFDRRGMFDTGTLWTNTVHADFGYLHLRATSADAVDSLAEVAFAIEEVAVFSPARYASRMADDRRSCNYNESCVQNAECYTATQYPGIAVARSAVAHMVFPFEGFHYICSGGLLNDQPSSQQRYFLSAHHCISVQSSATGLETIWDYRRAGCVSTCPTSGSFPSTLGATILEARASNDFLALELASIPAGRAWYGWDGNPGAVALGAFLYRLSHPSGAPQSYSVHQVAQPVFTCSGLKTSDFLYMLDLLGATEGGSSGSPVTNANAVVLGQLFGVCGPAPSVACDRRNYGIDGRFSNTFPFLRYWLAGYAKAPETQVSSAFWSVAPAYQPLIQPEFSPSAGNGTFALDDAKTGRRVEATITDLQPYSDGTLAAMVQVSVFDGGSDVALETAMLVGTGRHRVVSSGSRGNARVQTQIQIRAVGVTPGGHKVNVSLRGRLREEFVGVTHPGAMLLAARGMDDMPLQATIAYGKLAKGSNKEMAWNNSSPESAVRFGPTFTSVVWGTTFGTKGPTNYFTANVPLAGFTGTPVPGELGVLSNPAIAERAGALRVAIRSRESRVSFSARGEHYLDTTAPTLTWLTNGFRPRQVAMKTPAAQMKFKQ